jgi:hypothetical protein
MRICDSDGCVRPIQIVSLLQHSLIIYNISRRKKYSHNNLIININNMKMICRHIAANKRIGAKKVAWQRSTLIQ